MSRSLSGSETIYWMEPVFCPSDLPDDPQIGMAIAVGKDIDSIKSKDDWMGDVYLCLSDGVWIRFNEEHFIEFCE